MRFHVKAVHVKTLQPVLTYLETICATVDKGGLGKTVTSVRSLL